MVGPLSFTGPRRWNWVLKLEKAMFVYLLGAVDVDDHDTERIDDGRAAHVDRLRQPRIVLRDVVDTGLRLDRRGEARRRFVVREALGHVARTGRQTTLDAIFEDLEREAESLL